MRLVVGELESADLKVGQRLAPEDDAAVAESVDESPYPPDLGRARTKAERQSSGSWRASTAPAGSSKDTCTGHFYTLASCNPNGCGAPETLRQAIGKLIDEGKTDKEIWDELAKHAGR